jgi:glycerate 2-kinase
MPPRPLRVVIAPDSFGGALDSVGVATAVANGWSRIRPGDTLVRAPMADGGEGTLAAVGEALGDTAERRTTQVSDPLGRPVDADWLVFDDGRGAFIELAAASGLARLARDERTPENARRASTRGTGELILAALDAGVDQVTVGLGGSATTDGGAGLMSALGLRVMDAGGAAVPDGGAALAAASRADVSGVDERLGRVTLTIACDVTNPLTGERGAAATYGPQKGADAAAVDDLDAALRHWGDIMEAATGRLVADLPGAGAAGGTTGGLLAFTQAVLRPGVEVVAELAHLADHLAGADLVITGEGRADEQTLSGKAAMGVARLAPKGVPVVLLCGGLGPGIAALEASNVFALVQPIPDRPMDLEASMGDTQRLVENAAERLARSVGIGLGLADA